MLGMVQLMDSVPQTGGYGDCFGIEQLVSTGVVSRSEELRELVISALQLSIGPADGITAGAVFQASRQGDFDQLPLVAAELGGSHTPKDLQLASLQTGAHIWEASRRWPWACVVHEQLDGIAQRTGLFHAVAFGMLISEATAQRARAIATCLLAAAKSIVIEAARWIPLDSDQTHRVLIELQPTISQLALAYSQPDIAPLPIAPPERVIAAFKSRNAI